MNCHEFENLVVDLARCEVIDSSVGTRCWAHAAGCPRCAERLLEQEKLTAGLEALTVRTDAMRAPDQIEALLRRKFRDHFAAKKVAIPRRPSPWELLHGIWITGSLRAWAVAAAILLVALAGILVAKYRTPSLTNTTAQIQAAAKSTESHPAMESNNLSAHAGLQEHSIMQSPSPVSVSKSRKSASGKNNPNAPVRATFRTETQVEVATNFYPLPYGSGLPLNDGWEIVRVSLPRSALATLGVPLAGEQSSTPIKADLLLGEDGLARAIRFVE